MEGGPVSLKTHRKLGSDTSVKSLGPPDQEEQATIQPAKATHSNNVPTGLKTTAQLAVTARSPRAKSS